MNNSDLLNTTVAIPSPIEEIALPIDSRKRKLTREDLVDYYGGERLQLSNKTVQNILNRLLKATYSWHAFIENSFLAPGKQKDYASVITSRVERLFPES